MTTATLSRPPCQIIDDGSDRRLSVVQKIESAIGGLNDALMLMDGCHANKDVCDEIDRIADRLFHMKAQVRAVPTVDVAA